jgi:hypothetical protein
VRSLATTTRGRNRELVRRALYAINAVKRVGRKVLSGKTVKDALRTEQRNFKAHQGERTRRLASDRAIDAAVELYGPVLSWNLGPNENHCPVCVGRDGSNFRADAPPNGENPGSAHPHCECYAGPPRPEGGMI